MIRNNVDDVIKRVNDFHHAKKGALIQIKSIKEYRGKKKPLDSYNLPSDMKVYLDDMIQNFIQYWEKRKNVNDDVFPAISPWYGIAEHTAFLGGKVDFSENTSWHHPVIKEWTDMDKLAISKENDWFKLVVEGMYYLKERAKGRYFVKLRGGESPMDIANILRGNDMFYDFFEYPQEIKALFDFCAEGELFMLKEQSKACDEVGGGVITGFDVWLPKNGAGHLSEDASTMISREHYTEFGIPYTEKVTSQFDHIFMHTHSLGIQNIPLIAKVKNIDHIEISNDPNAMRAMDVYKKLEDDLKDKVVVVAPTLEELKTNLSFLENKKTIIWYDAETEKEANEVISIVRSIHS